jgi:hypothetical protein
MVKKASTSHTDSLIITKTEVRKLGGGRFDGIHHFGRSGITWRHVRCKRETKNKNQFFSDNQ